MHRINGACSILQGNEDAKSAEQVTESKGSVEAFKAASTTHPVAATEDSMDDDQTGMAADVAPPASTDVPTGVHADKAAAAHLAERTGEQYLNRCCYYILLRVMLSQHGMLSEGCRVTKHPTVYFCTVSGA